MSSWGNFVWGDGTLYGAVTNESLTWGVEVDWDNDHTFDGSNEAVNLVAFSSFRGRQSYLDLGEGGFVAMQTGSAQITLKNSDGRYDAWNTASPLYPNVRDGREVRIRVVDLRTGTIYPLFYGVVTDIQASNYGEEPTVVLCVEDGWRNLRRATARVAMNQNITPDVAIGLVLDAAKWPIRWGRSLDAASDNIRYFWSSGSRDAAAELRRLVESFLGYFSITASGVARFTTRVNVPESVEDLTQEELLKDVYLAQPWENRRNITRIKVHPLSVAASVTLWQWTGSAPAIMSGTPLVIWADYTYNNAAAPAKNVVTPVATTDWTANTASDGSGTNKTAQVSLAFSDFGDSAKLIFSYSGGGTVYLISPKIRGDAVYEINAADVTYPDDISTTEDPREFLLDLPWQQDINVAIDFARVIGLFLSDDHPFPHVKVDSRPALQFTPDIFSVATAQIARLGIDGVAFRVAGIGHQTVGENCQQVITTFYLEPYISVETFWVWPILDFGVDTIFGW
jgi:hypothetical protein